MKRRIIFRLSDTLYKQASDAIDMGKAKSTSELVRIALKEYLTEESTRRTHR